jgi:hypothetical protein
VILTGNNPADIIPIQNEKSRFPYQKTRKTAGKSDDAFRNANQ